MAGTEETAPLCDEVLELLSSGLVMSLGTCDAALAPECVPAMGSRAHRDRKMLTVFVPSALIGATLINLQRNDRLALSVARPSDEKTMQIKGRARDVRAATAADRAVPELLRGALAEQLAIVGLPRHLTRRLAWWPCTAIDVEVEDVFVQTPGPGAGRRLAR